MNNLTVSNIMTIKPITVGPDDSVVFAAKTLSEGGFNGLPVINEKKELIGIITEYDFISRGDTLHLPTLISILGNINFYKKDKDAIKDDLKNY